MSANIISELRERIAHLEGGIARKAIVLPFGVPEIDCVLPRVGPRLLVHCTSSRAAARIRSTARRPP